MSDNGKPTREEIDEKLAELTGALVGLFIGKDKVKPLTSVARLLKPEELHRSLYLDLSRSYVEELLRKAFAKLVVWGGCATGDCWVINGSVKDTSPCILCIEFLTAPDGGTRLDVAVYGKEPLIRRHFAETYYAAFETELRKIAGAALVSMSGSTSESGEEERL